MGSKRSVVVISPELKNRLVAAKKNGSVIAEDILKALNKRYTDLIFKNPHINNLKSKRCVSTTAPGAKAVTIKLLVCRKDVNNPNFPGNGDPSATQRVENQDSVSTGTFVDLFRGFREYSDEEIMYFDSALRCASPLTIKIESTYDAFVTAYSEDSYSVFVESGNYPLWSSCMRHSACLEPLADFYANLVHAKIMVVYDRDKAVVGRAIIWPSLTMTRYDGKRVTPNPVSLMDRLYFSYEFVRPMMIKAAQRQGILFRKTENNYSTQRRVTLLRPMEETALGVRASDIGNEIDGEGSCHAAVFYTPILGKHYKKGAPYLDTMCYLGALTQDEQVSLVLSNSDTIDGSRMSFIPLANGQSTKGYMDSSRRICPVCGRVYCARDSMINGVCMPACARCAESYYKPLSCTGGVFGVNCREYDGSYYPKSCFNRRGTITEAMHKYLLVAGCTGER